MAAAIRYIWIDFWPIFPQSIISATSHLLLLREIKGSRQTLETTKTVKSSFRASEQSAKCFGMECRQKGRHMRGQLWQNAVRTTFWVSSGGFLAKRYLRTFIQTGRYFPPSSHIKDTGAPKANDMRAVKGLETFPPRYHRYFLIVRCIPRTNVIAFVAVQHGYSDGIQNKSRRGSLRLGRHQPVKATNVRPLNTFSQSSRPGTQRTVARSLLSY